MFWTIEQIYSLKNNVSVGQNEFKLWDFYTCVNQHVFKYVQFYYYSSGLQLVLFPFFPSVAHVLAQIWNNMEHS